MGKLTKYNQRYTRFILHYSYAAMRDITLNYCNIWLFHEISEQSFQFIFTESNLNLWHLYLDSELSKYSWITDMYTTYNICTIDTNEQYIICTNLQQNTGLKHIACYLVKFTFTNWWNKICYTIFKHIILQYIFLIMVYWAFILYLTN